MGKCIFESSCSAIRILNVKARFMRSFLAQLIGLRVNYKVRPRPLVRGGGDATLPLSCPMSSMLPNNKLSIIMLHVDA